MVRRTHEVRRRQILGAVAHLISTKGMARVTIDDIAREVGVTEGAIYRHFTSKREIFSYVIRAWRESLLSGMPSEADDGASALERLEQAFWSQLTEAENHRALVFMVIVQAISFEGEGLGVEVAAVVTEYLEALERILAAGIQGGSIRAGVNVNAAATTFFGMLQSTASLWAINGYKTGMAEQRTQMWEIFTRGMAASPGVPEQAPQGQRAP